MLNKYFLFLLVVFFMVNSSFLTSAESLNITVDGISVGTVDGIFVDEVPLCDAKSIASRLEAKYFRLAGTYVEVPGFIYQYGKTITIVQEGNDKGFVACVETDVVPNVQTDENGVVYSPYTFLALAVNGSATYDDTTKTISFILGPKAEIGDIEPKTVKFTEQLEDSGYIVQQGDINQAYPVQVCNDGYTPDCNANNSNYPYMMTLVPPYPGLETTPDLSWMVRMKSQEAIVFMGQTPPECIYFSYINYLMNRYYSEKIPPIKKLFASLGDSVSNYKLSKKGDGKKVFQIPIMIIAAADENTVDAIKKAAKKAKFSKKYIHTLVLPYELLRFGLEETADVFGFLHRTSLYVDEDEKNTYLSRPTLEVLRITPISPDTPEYLPMDSFIPRGSGIQEFALNPTLEELRSAIIKQYEDDYDYEDLTPMVWLPEGMAAIQQKENVLGEDRDTIYLRTEEDFTIGDDDIVVVYGVNHTMTGQSVYSNVSCYGSTYINGFGGINNTDYTGTADAYLPDNDDAENFYVWKFARSQIDDQTYVVPEDVNNNLTGINKSDNAFMGFRAYINTKTLVGPAHWEVLYDRAIKFTRKK